MQALVLKCLVEVPVTREGFILSTFLLACITTLSLNSFRPTDIPVTNAAIRVIS